MRLRPLSGPVVVQVNEAEPAASLRGQAEGVLEELSRVQVLEPLSAAAAFLGPEFLGKLLTGRQPPLRPEFASSREVGLREFGLSPGGAP